MMRDLRTHAIYVAVTLLLMTAFLSFCGVLAWLIGDPAQAMKVVLTAPLLLALAVVPVLWASACHAACRTLPKADEYDECREGELFTWTTSLAILILVGGVGGVIGGKLGCVAALWVGAITLPQLMLRSVRHIYGLLEEIRLMAESHRDK